MTQKPQKEGDTNVKMSLNCEVNSIFDKKKETFIFTKQRKHFFYNKN